MKNARIAFSAIGPGYLEYLSSNLYPKKIDFYPQNPVKGAMFFLSEVKRPV
jgi:hypothetical protein